MKTSTTHDFLKNTRTCDYATSTRVRGPTSAFARGPTSAFAQSKTVATTTATTKAQDNVRSVTRDNVCSFDPRSKEEINHKSNRLFEPHDTRTKHPQT